MVGISQLRNSPLNPIGVHFTTREKSVMFREKSFIKRSSRMAMMALPIQRPASCPDSGSGPSRGIGAAAVAACGHWQDPFEAQVDYAISCTIDFKQLAGR
jgi:hypothetical protein